MGVDVDLDLDMDPNKDIEWSPRARALVYYA